MDGNKRHPRSARNGGDSRPAQHAQYPNYPEYGGQDQNPPIRQTSYGTPYPQYASDPQQTPPAGYNGQRELRHGPRDGVWLLVVILCAAMLVACGIFAVSLYNGHYPAFREKVQKLNSNTFMTGVHVDGIHIGGMTMEQARQVLSSSNEAQDRQYAMSVVVDGKTWRITQNELPLQRNTEAVLQEAYSIGRQSSASVPNSAATPFEYRSRMQQEAEKYGAYLYTKVTYDKATVRSLSEKLSALVSSPARDATVYSFDFATRSFQYQAEQSGTYLSSDDIYNAITGQMDMNGCNGTITLHTSPQQPNVTMAQLQQNFGLIASYSTDTLASYNRNKNIELACKALNGTVLESGKTLSFNETTGRRTVDKGYLMAPAIAQGRSYEEAGGGVCQVSSTLFNAAVLANMKIVTSSPHAWPSAYVEPGRDATVDWQSGQKLEESLDLKIRNNSAYPIFIVSYITGTNFHRICLCTVEIYGVNTNDGVTIDLITELAEEPTPSPTPRQPEYVPADADHPSGTVETIVAGREGYKYKTYRVYYRDGVEKRRELIRTSNYRPYAEQVRIYQ